MIIFFTQLMINYFNGHEWNTGFSTKCPGEKNFPRQAEKSTKTVRLRKISSPGSYVDKLVFYTMESPDKSKFLINQYYQTFQNVHVP